MFRNQDVNRSRGAAELDLQMIHLLEIVEAGSKKFHPADDPVVFLCGRMFQSDDFVIHEKLNVEDFCLIFWTLQEKCEALCHVILP